MTYYLQQYSGKHGCADSLKQAGFDSLEYRLFIGDSGSQDSSIFNF